MHILMMITSLLVTTSIYTIQFNDIDGVPQSMNQYKGKKILIVNIGTSSKRADQLRELQKLQQQYSESLVVLGFPSNSFNHETEKNSSIKQVCQNQYGVSFLLAEKNEVTGAKIQPLYKWLTSQTDNGAMNNPVGADFQKFLINESGRLIGVFSPSLPPFSHEIIEAIKN